MAAARGNAFVAATAIEENAQQPLFRYDNVRRCRVAERQAPSRLSRKMQLPPIILLLLSFHPSYSPFPWDAILRRGLRWSPVTTDREGLSMRFVMAILVVAGLSGFALPSWADNSAALVTAATTGDVAAARGLLAGGADSNSRDANGYSALNWAALNGHLDIAKLLIDHGADVNAHDNPKRLTPLMNAAGMGHDDIAELLVSRGADVNVLDATGAQALLWARARARSSLMTFLLAHGADPLPELGKEYGSPQSCYMRQGDHILLTGHIGKRRPSDPMGPGQLPWIDAPACPADSFRLTTTGALPASCQEDHVIRFSGTISRTVSVTPGKLYTVNTQSVVCD